MSDDPPPRRGLGPAFWAMIAFGVVAALAGAVVGFAGPELFPTSKPAAAAPDLGKPPPPR